MQAVSVKITAALQCGNICGTSQGPCGALPGDLLVAMSSTPSVHTFAACSVAKGPCSDRGQAKEGEKYVACDISHYEVIWLDPSDLNLQNM